MCQLVENKAAQPVLSTQAGDEYGGATKVDVYSRYDMQGKITLRKMLADNHGVEAHLDARHPHNEDQLKYRDSGVWYKSRGKHGELEIRFTVGCSCEGDCCGHMCSLGITVQQTESHFVVITSMSFNY